MAMAFPTTGIEFQFPVPSDISPDTGVVLTDSRKPIRLQKNSTSARQEIANIQVKVRDSGMKAWFDFIQANYAQNANWELSGVQLFTRASTSVVVKIVGYTEPIKPEDAPLYWQHQITLLYVSDQ